MDPYSSICSSTSSDEYKLELKYEEEMELDVDIIKEDDSSTIRESTTQKESSPTPQESSPTPQESQTTELNSSVAQTCNTTDHKVCGVCDRPAKYKHFGAPCCDSCKSFFRRSVQSKLWQIFFCPEGGSCNIKTSKRKCRACRFAKCISIGMDMKLVMSMEAREILLSRRTERLAMERKNYISCAPQTSMQEEDPIPKIGDMSREVGPDPHRLDQSQDDIICTYSSEENLSTKDKFRITSLQRNLEKALSSSDFSTNAVENGMNEQLLFLFCKHMGVFFSSVPEFQKLNSEGQATLLKPAIAKAIFIYGVHQFERGRDCWPKRALAHSFPVITISDMENFIDNHDLMFNWTVFTEKFGDFYSDEIVTLLTLMIALFDDHATCSSQNPTFGYMKAYFIGILKRYMKLKDPMTNIPYNLALLTESLAEVEHLRHCFQNSSTKDKEVKDRKIVLNGRYVAPSSHVMNHIKNEQDYQNYSDIVVVE